LAVYDANILYRLSAQELSVSTWHSVFGGGSTSSSTGPKGSGSPSSPKSDDVVTSSPFKHERRMVKERFIAPETSMFNYLMTRPLLKTGVLYDSTKFLNDEQDESDTDDTTSGSSSGAREHLEPDSFSWRLLRYAVVKHCLGNVNSFLHLVGIDLREVVTGASMIRSIVKLLEHWQNLLKSDVDRFPGGRPSHYLPADKIPENTPVYAQYSILANPDNTPFWSEHYSALPVKRLWNYLVTQESVRDIFVHHIYSSQMPNSASGSENMKIPSFDSDASDDQMKVVYSGHDSLMCFCNNQADPNNIAVATPKAILELNNTAATQGASAEQIEPGSESELKLVSSRRHGRSVSLKATLSSLSRSRRHSNKLRLQCQFRVVKTQRISGVRKMSSHPQSPCYLSASQDGCICLSTWGSDTGPVCITKESNARITQVVFSGEGNKFAVSDDSGLVSLWLIGPHITEPARKCLSFKCHSKATNDVLFLGMSSSLLATAGQSDDMANVCLWDSLLARPLVHAFECHSEGATSLIFMSRHQTVVSAGRRGDICVWDVRQRRLQHRILLAHETSIKCMTFGVDEDYFATGSVDGDIKVWDVSTCGLLCSFAGVHCRSSSVRHSILSGVTALRVATDGRLWSSGVDGSLRVHRLPWLLNGLHRGTYRSQSSADGGPVGKAAAAVNNSQDMNCRRLDELVTCRDSIVSCTDNDSDIVAEYYTQF
jgi:WD40 repeat protein